MSDQSVREDKGLPGWVIALIVVCGACLCGIPVIGGAVAVLVPKIQMQQARTVCADRLRTVGLMHIESMLDHGRARPPGGGGVKYFLRLTQSAPEGGIVLICPEDRHATPAQVVQVGDDPMTAASEPMLRAICSFMVRDFKKYPIDHEAMQLNIIAAEREEFHPGGINILYDDGSVRFRDREWLGIPAGAPIVVGAESDVDELKKLCIVAEE